MGVGGVGVGGGGGAGGQAGVSDGVVVGGASGKVFSRMAATVRREKSINSISGKAVGLTVPKRQKPQPYRLGFCR